MANLDFLRATAVGLVFFFHVLTFFGVRVEALGIVGVLFFFVHTTLVLMLSLERNSLSWSKFMVRRAFRIYPLACLIVTVVFVAKIPQSSLAAHHMEFVGAGTKTFLSNLLLIQNLTNTESSPGVLWSLPYEFQMYLFLPALFLFAKRYSRLWLLCLWVAAAVFAWAPIPHKPSFLLYVPCFVPGVLAFQRIRSTTKIPFMMFPLLLAALVGLYAWRPRITTGWAMCLILGLTLPLFRQCALGALNSVSKTVAKYSYGIYLTHTLALWAGFVALKDAGWVLQITVFLAVALGSPTLLYHAVEEPFIRLGTRLVSPAKLAGRAATAP